MWAFPPHRILVAVDFSDAAAAAVQAAGELARGFDGVLTALHAESFDAPPYFTREQITAIEKQRVSARHEAQRYLLRFTEPRARWPVTAVVAEAPPADAILDASRQQDLIVMGTHGRRGPARWWAGSVAERVVRDAQVPVLVIRGDSPDRAQLFDRISIVEGTAAFTGAARRYAQGLAATFDGTLSTEGAASVRPAALKNATLIVLPQPGVRWLQLFPGPEERALRDCQRALLFVPST
jgi:nucleotide-binding universal stress UspA family protein